MVGSMLVSSDLKRQAWPQRTPWEPIPQSTQWAPIPQRTPWAPIPQRTPLAPIPQRTRQGSFHCTHSYKATSKYEKERLGTLEFPFTWDYCFCFTKRSQNQKVSQHWSTKLTLKVTRYLSFGTNKFLIVWVICHLARSVCSEQGDRHQFTLELML